MANIFVGNLGVEITEEQLVNLFKAFGAVGFPQGNVPPGNIDMENVLCPVRACRQEQ